MSTPHQSFDLPIDPGVPAAPPDRRQDYTRLFLTIPTMLAAAAIAITLDGPLLFAGIAVVGVFALFGAWVLQQGSLVAADSIVLVGRGPMAAVIASSLENRAGRGRRALRVLRAQTMAEAASLVRAVRCDEVIVAGAVCPGPTYLVDARAQRPAIRQGAETIEDLLGRVPIEFVAVDRTLANVDAVRPFSRGYAIAKRVMDLAFAFGLGFAILPLLPLMALAIKLDSAGPIFYSQRRVGLGGRNFRIYKFRTMRQDAERNGAVWAAEKDPRITRVGRVMRLMRIDELPQLWNVVRGEMSVVGPRPERPEFTVQLAEEIEGYDKRHAVKPGLTGWAQVCYRYASSVKDTRSKVEYDLYYVKHAGIWLDFAILWRTIGVVLGMRGR